LEEFLAEDKQNMEQINSTMSDESKQRDLVLEDEEEDFLDDGNDPLVIFLRKIAQKDCHYNYMECH